MPRFAANLSMMFNEVPFLDRFAKAREAGFTAVEFLFPYEHSIADVQKRMSDAGVEIVLFNMPAGDWAAGERGLAALPERAQEFTDGIAKALDYAEALKVPRLHMMAGNADAGDSIAQARYRKALIEAAEAAAAKSIDVVIEPINSRDMPAFFLNSFATAEAVIGELGRGNIKLQYDIYHRQIMHGDVARSLERLLPITAHVQVASVPLRNEPNSGELNDSYLFDLLDRLGYQGHIGCEYRPAGDTVEGLGWFKPYAGR